MIRAVWFDAVGTILYPEPPVTQIYQQVASQYGVHFPEIQIRERLKEVYSRQETVDRSRDWSTSEDRELERWHEVVVETFRESPQREQIFQELYHWFAQPTAWRLFEDFLPTLDRLLKRNLPVGLASNFDKRLRTIVNEMPELSNFRTQLLISSEMGCRKPGKQFFQRVIEHSGCSAPEILFVGDDRVNDFQAAKACGMRSLLVERAPKSSHEKGTISSLIDVQRFLD
ncbi:HAD-IA family hydrolase [Telmatocola sphagniphila]|uniref:HAD-IA family hydrolase n=1 Tax=Telmatocola sphagniphila TaxID=1123043 RepID=A0A8E6B9C1_9BACT|nr:HAD-IA family hydrolase [Telmatocola sphagniphila]QVL32943.1 HAD-IA family hydrolase [Telmatocola sphagniphila]